MSLRLPFPALQLSLHCLADELCALILTHQNVNAFTSASRQANFRLHNVERRASHT